MNAKRFPFTATIVLLVSGVSLQALATDLSKEIFKARWNPSVQHSKVRTQDILQGAEAHTKRVDSDIEKRMGHRLSKEARHTKKYWPHLKK